MSIGWLYWVFVSFFCCLLSLLGSLMLPVSVFRLIQVQILCKFINFILGTLMLFCFFLILLIFCILDILCLRCVFVFPIRIIRRLQYTIICLFFILDILGLSCVLVLCIECYALPFLISLLWFLQVQVLCGLITFLTYIIILLMIFLVLCLVYFPRLVRFLFFMLLCVSFLPFFILIFQCITCLEFFILPSVLVCFFSFLRMFHPLLFHLIIMIFSLILHFLLCRLPFNLFLSLLLYL